MPMQVMVMRHKIKSMPDRMFRLMIAFSGELDTNRLNNGINRLIHVIIGQLWQIGWSGAGVGIKMLRGISLLSAN